VEGKKHLEDVRSNLLVSFCFTDEIYQKVVFDEPPLEEICLQTMKMFYLKKKKRPELCFLIRSICLFLRERFQGKVTRDKFVHCIINEQPSAAKVLKPEVDKMLEDVGNEVNFVKLNLKYTA
jgi:hypothetical protein